MLWCSLVELDALLSIIMIIIYGLLSLRSKQIHLSDVYFFCRLFPLLFVFGFYLDTVTTNNLTDVFSFTQLLNVVPSIDMLLAILLFVIMYNFNSFESVLLLVFAFIGQYYMLHSMDLLTFYIALEAQNFCFLVLCGLPGVTGRNSSFSVEASLKYFLLSAFSSGVILFWFSAIYLQTGLSVLSFFPKGENMHLDSSLDTSLHSFQILCAMMFKLGAAPLHLWVIQIYNGVKRNLLMYISTAPKLSLFGFWVGSFQTVWTDYSLLLFSAFSIALGAFGAYSQPTLRSLFAYSTVNEIGLLLSALETAGFNSLFQHLGIYIISQILLWNLSDKRLFTVLAVSLAGLPPLAGFFGKAWIFWHVSTVGLYSLLILALFCAAISLVYYLRVLRLFWNASQSNNTRVIQCNGLVSFAPFGRKATGSSNKLNSAIYYPYSLVPTTTVGRGAPVGSGASTRVQLTSACVVLLVVIPLFLIKPFVL
jgi:NADH:ubiquinone oxidoreductase subunit 2 (subunit N)